jgi:hypothetical protein
VQNAINLDMLTIPDILDGFWNTQRARAASAVQVRDGILCTSTERERECERECERKRMRTAQRMMHERVIALRRAHVDCPHN